MIIDANQLALAMQRKLLDMQERLITTMTNGCADWDAYQHALGSLHATKELVTWIGDAIRRDGAIEGMK